MLSYNSIYEAEEAGEYVLTVTDSAMNTESDSTVVTEVDLSEPLQIAKQPEGGEMKRNVNFYGDTPYLSLKIVMANGVSPYKYDLYYNGKPKDSKNGTMHAIFTVFDPGEYYIHVEDAVGRKIDSVKVTVTAPSN